MSVALCAAALAASLFDVAESLKVADAPQLHVGAHYSRLPYTGNRIHFHTGHGSSLPPPSAFLLLSLLWSLATLKKSSVISVVRVIQEGGENLRHCYEIRFPLRSLRRARPGNCE